MKIIATTESTSISLMEVHGGYSVILILIAIGLGVTAVIKRRQKFSIFSACVIVGIAFAGLGATFWSLTQMNIGYLFRGPGMAANESDWLGDFAFSCARAGVVLPACGIALVLVGFSFLFPKQNVKKIEQVAALNP